ncbi:EthD domain-containing protein [Cryptosporangium aurantiacum]|uniref:EthD domain-containing protein n=1 Tax=Cryptosporangium aurantiacum TaxID=134849 RepID=A0A1M7R465_9ACTN|nr:EthD domain-containing protein [Cryptosporangium aurantiacum]SHN39784.1 EthD domain-containing protein [Cryptosporangium aurantiacum]
MIKVLLFVKRKDGLSREEFRARYESGHVPLAIAELEHLRRYARNFVRPVKGLPEPGFDVVTEFWFEDWEAWKATSAYALGETGRTLAEDEAVFMDRASMRFVVVDEHVSDVDAVRASASAGSA